MCRSQTKSQNGVAKIVPVNHQSRISQKRDQTCNGEGGNGRWVLDQHPFRGPGPVGKCVVKAPYLPQDLERRCAEEEDPIVEL